MTEEENILIENYLLGNLTSEEVFDVEKRMLLDDRFRESVLLQKQLFETQNETEWSFAEKVDTTLVQEYEQLLKSEETIALKSAIEEASNSYQLPQKKKSKSIVIYLSAAVIALLICMTIFMTSTIDSQEIYAAYYNIDDLPSFVTRNTTKNEALIDAQSYFENKEYDKALPLWNEQLPLIQKNKANVMIYKGLTEIELGISDEAFNTFTKLTQTDLVDASKGYWYIALLHFKLDKPEEGKKVLEHILRSKDNYNYKEAKEILEKL